MSVRRCFCYGRAAVVVAHLYSLRGGKQRLGLFWIVSPVDRGTVNRR